MNDDFEPSGRGPVGRGSRGRGPGGRGPGGRGPGGRGPGGRGRGGPRGHRSRIGRGDVRIAVVTLLAEDAMHGYQIMSELADRSSGAWQPSPGSIYPLLQQLADEGLVIADEADGRKVYRLTDAGRELAAETADQPPIWERFGSGETTDLRAAVGDLAAAAMQVAKTGTSDQRTRAAEIIVEARKRLYQLLAE